MKNSDKAKIIVARYKKGFMTKQQVLDYIGIALSAEYDAEAIEYIKANL